MAVPSLAQLAAAAVLNQDRVYPDMDPILRDLVWLPVSLLWLLDSSRPFDFGEIHQWVITHGRENLEEEMVAFSLDASHSSDKATKLVQARMWFVYLYCTDRGIPMYLPLIPRTIDIYRTRQYLLDNPDDISSSRINTVLEVFESKKELAPCLRLETTVRSDGRLVMITRKVPSLLLDDRRVDPTE